MGKFNLCFEKFKEDKFLNFEREIVGRQWVRKK